MLGACSFGNRWMFEMAWDRFKGVERCLAIGCLNLKKWGI